LERCGFLVYNESMENIYIVEDVGSEKTQWYIAYKNPIQGEMLAIDEEDAKKLLILKNEAITVN